MTTDHQTCRFWAHALGMLRNLIAAMGMPAALFNGPRLPFRTWRHFCNLVADCESWVRRLLLRDALAYPEVKSAGRAHAGGARFPGRSGWLDPESAHWQAHFHMSAAAGGAAPAPKGLGYEPHARFAPFCVLRCPKMLAERLEALIRVIANPAPYVARLARRLQLMRQAAREKDGALAPNFLLGRDGRLAPVFRDMGLFDAAFAKAPDSS